AAARRSLAMSSLKCKRAGDEVSNLYPLAGPEQRPRRTKSSRKGAEFRRASFAGGCGRLGRGETGPRILLHHELSPRQFRKTPALCDQLIESSAFDHAPCV